MTKSFAQSIAQFLEREHPDLIVSEMAKVKRKGKVFIDWSQNSEHKSTVAVYSLRAKGERPFVAMPVTWNELKKAIQKDDASSLFFEPEAGLKMLKKTGDLFAPALKLKQKLPKPFLELEPNTNGETRSNSKALRHIVKSVTSAKHLSRLLQLHGQAAKEAAGYLSYKSTLLVICTTISVWNWAVR